MRAAVGLTALNAGYLGVGLAFLLGLGLVRTGREALRLAGLALVAGWALTGIGSTLARSSRNWLRCISAWAACTCELRVSTPACVNSYG